MPNIFDNIDLEFMPELKKMLETAHAADFCVGYFNLRGWGPLGRIIDERFSGGDQSCCRLLIGMQSPPQDELRSLYGVRDAEMMDQGTAKKLKRKMAEEFKEQLVIGAPTTQDESTLRMLSRQLKEEKVKVKLYVKKGLHAKLYIAHRTVHGSKAVGYVGSSNLTVSGLQWQYELNVDVKDDDSVKKLCTWFEDRWKEMWSLDISDELAAIIDESWAREDLIPPYEIYIRMAYHLANEARSGLGEFKIPAVFGDRLFEFQANAVKIAAHHLNSEKRRGVILGDVVGLGKTLMATALARIFQEDLGLETLVLCPPNLISMWEDYMIEYGLSAKVMSIGKADKDLEDLRRFRLLILDESHNLRNREGKRYQAIREYIEKNECRCVLLSATPYNKSYLDLGAQLRLFIDEGQDVGLRPDALIRDIGEPEFHARHQCPIRSIAAFEQSPYPDDWRELMRLFMVRRTRGFIKDNYTILDEKSGRKYLLLANGDRNYFPARVARTIRFDMDEAGDAYARLYSDQIVKEINGLSLARYGLGNYIDDNPKIAVTAPEKKILDDLGRAGRRLMGFCRTNLFKRLESSGLSFILSIERHILRNYIYLYAIENGLPIPIGTTDPGMLDLGSYDLDADDTAVTGSVFDEDEEESTAPEAPSTRVPTHTEEDFRQKAEKVYESYSTIYKKRFKWLPSELFVPSLAEKLRDDAESLSTILREHGTWDHDEDTKVQRLMELVNEKHKDEKVIVFSQFADTVDYLTQELKRRGVASVVGVTGNSGNPAKIVWRFSPKSNNKKIDPADEIRVLVSTDVLSEGQNLQDAHIVVNFDLPWAIIRLIQRTGRVDRIGQKHDEIYCYTFYPMDGVDRILKLRDRVRKRLVENGEVVGSDEQFFEDLKVDPRYRDLYDEKSSVLDDDEDNEVDLSSHAYQIWKNAIDKDKSLKKRIEDMPNVVFSAKGHDCDDAHPEGALVYLAEGGGNDALAWVNSEGKIVSHSPLAVLRAAECEPTTPAIERADNHHDIVRSAVKQMIEEEMTVGGELGRKSGARYKTYMRLKGYAESDKNSLFVTDDLRKTIDDIYQYPLRRSASDTLNRQLRSGITDEELADLCISLRDEERLSLIGEEAEQREPIIICSLGLKGEVAE